MGVWGQGGKTAGGIYRPPRPEGNPGHNSRLNGGVLQPGGVFGAFSLPHFSMSFFVKVTCSWGGIKEVSIFS